MREYARVCWMRVVHSQPHQSPPLRACYLSRESPPARFLVPGQPASKSRTPRASPPRHCLPHHCPPLARITAPANDMQRSDGDDSLVVDCWAFSCKVRPVACRGLTPAHARRPGSPVPGRWSASGPATLYVTAAHHQRSLPHFLPSSPPPQDPCLQGQPQITTASCGDGNLIARLMELNMLADAAAQALMDSRALLAADAAALLSLWPWLLRLTVEAQSASSCSPFAAQAGIVLAERSGAPPAAAAFTCPALATAQPPHGSMLRFEMAAPAGPQQQAELQVFVQQLRLGVEQSSKEAMEEALSEISRLPSACEIVRGSIEGQQQPMLSLRSLLKRRSSTLSSAGNSCTDTPLRWSRNSDA